MPAYRHCRFERAAALALTDEESGRAWIRGVLRKDVAENFGLPPAVGYLAHAVLDSDEQIPALMAALAEGADLSLVPDRFMVWALAVYAEPCAEGHHLAWHYLRFAQYIASLPLEGCKFDQDLQAALQKLGSSLPLKEARTLTECAFLAAKAVLTLRPASAAFVAYAMLRAQELIVGRDTSARDAMRYELLRLLRAAPMCRSLFPFETPDAQRSSS